MRKIFILNNYDVAIAEEIHLIVMFYLINFDDSVIE